MLGSDKSETENKSESTTKKSEINENLISKLNIVDVVNVNKNNKNNCNANLINKYNNKDVDNNEII